MGMLVKFSPKDARSVPATTGGSSAQVILFTGVRYERGAGGNKPTPAPKVRRTRKG
ncbi:hypothetical protein SAMN05428936_101564 [Pelagibacterium halotolerans]|nr:hypothetical protein SAMN05428936_101564 [Pelagibacterium halotolerans]